MKNNDISKNISNTQKKNRIKYENTSPNITPKYHLILNNNNYILNRKNLYKKEKIKNKEYIFKSFKEVSKKVILKEKINFKNNHKKLLNSMAILNDTNLDEGIVLNKYFAYLKRSGIEYKEQMKLNYKNMITPIMKKEKEIKKMKKNINFYKSITNQMLLKYMIENKDKLNEYIKEIYTYRYKNNGFYREYENKSRNMSNLSEQSNSKTSSNNNNEYLYTLTNPNINNNENNIFLRNKLLANKKFVPNLKIENDINNLFITAYSRNKNSYSYINMAKTTGFSPRKSTIIKKKYFTPQSYKRRNKISHLNTEKSNNRTNFQTESSSKLKNNSQKKIVARYKLAGLDNTLSP